MRGCLPSISTRSWVSRPMPAPPRSSAPTSAWPCAGTRTATPTPAPTTSSGSCGRPSSASPSPSKTPADDAPPKRRPQQAAAPPPRRRPPPGHHRRPHRGRPRHHRHRHHRRARALRRLRRQRPAQLRPHQHVRQLPRQRPPAQRRPARNLRRLRRQGLHHRQPLPVLRGARLAAGRPPARRHGAPAMLPGEELRIAGQGGPAPTAATRATSTSPCAPALTRSSGCSTTTSTWRCR
jgi:hypothetical protein